MPYIYKDGYLVWASVDSPNTFTALDGTAATFSPLAVTTHSPDRESANVIRERLDRTVSVLLRGDRLRTGTLEMVFDNDTDAAIAEAILGRPTVFTYQNNQRPAVDLTFVRAGRMGTTVHDGIRNLWTFSVGFQEVTS